MKLILDSASNIRKENGFDCEVVPLTICTEEKEYVDDENLNVLDMVKDMEETSGRSRTSCPNINAYLKAIGKAKDAIIVTLASKISGSFNSANSAAGIYKEENEDANICVLDSNGVGPVQKLITEKYYECEKKGMNVKETFKALSDYSKEHVKIGYCLKSLKNLANNGRVNPVIAKFASAIGIRINGIFSDFGEIQPTHKSRGDKKALENLIQDMKERGYKGGKVIIDHCDGASFAIALREKIVEEFKNADVRIGITTGLCSFYAERGGVILGYEV